MKERGRRERNLKPEMQKTQGEKSDGVGTKDGQRQESDAPNGESLDEREVKIWCCFALIWGRKETDGTREPDVKPVQLYVLCLLRVTGCESLCTIVCIKTKTPFSA